MRILLAGLLACAVATAIARPVQAWPSVTREETRTFDLSANGNVLVQNSSGDIRVIGWDRAQVELLITKTALSSSDFSRLDAVVAAAPGEVAVRAVAPDNCLNCDVSFELHVPRGSHVTADTQSGDVKVETLAAPVRVETSSGDIALRDDEGEAHLHAASGDISIDGGRALIDAATSSGDIDGTNLGGSVNFVASSGALTADFARFDGVKSVRMESSDGDIQLIVPHGEGFKVEANTNDGAIHSNLRLPIHERDSGSDVAAQVGAGTIDVQLRTTSGDINIKMR